VIAAPVTYAVDGVQYVTVVSGWGGAFALAGGDAAAQGGGGSRGIVHTWALADQPITPEVVRQLLAGRPEPYRGREDLYHTWCARCHGARAVGAGVVADLRHAVVRPDAAFETIVREGIPSLGMPAFEGLLDAGQIDALAAYLRTRAEEDGIGRP